MAIITRDEALLVIKKWFDEETYVRCDFRLERMAGCMRGRIFKFDGQDLGLISADSRSELSMRLSYNATFGYGAFHGPTIDAENVVAILYPRRPEQEEQDYAAFSEDVIEP